MSSPDVQTGTATAALTATARCRIALGLMARRAIEQLRSIIPTEGDRELQPGELIRAARMVRALDLGPLEYAVVWELARGTTWAEVAAALGRTEADARSLYGEKAARWLADEPVPAGPVLTDGSRPTGLPDTPDMITIKHAADLEAWYLRTRDPADRVAGTGTPRPVTGELGYQREMDGRRAPRGR